MGELSHEVCENYLKEIYRLAQTDVPVKTSRLADALGLSAASVSEMVRRLDEQSLVRYQRYRGVTLTAKGQRRALLVLRRHRLWELFLHDVLGLPRAELHKHAERLEHATDGDLARYIDRYLGSPDFDPHGHPIPRADGVIAARPTLPLSEQPEGVALRIAHCVDDSDVELVAHFEQLGLLPGAEVVMIRRAPASGPLTLLVNDEQECVIGIEAARMLMVERA
ncbi:MAG: metal-dependent transcriptional regulator [Deltaproteobacteria bacterium]|nr:metal-dependent transcriptional regulator [Deltaproteobacteria bacterium]